MKARLAAWWGLIATREVEVGGLRLRVPPGVMDPQLFRVGAWLAEEVAADVRPGERLLDLGCGSGVVGALAQRAGAEIVAVDVDPRAVEAARANGLSDARCGDLFEPVAGLLFDRIVFNPPFFPGAGRGRPYRKALYGGAELLLVRRFSQAVVAHLAPNGAVWVAWSSRAPDPHEALGPGWRELRRRELDDERLMVLGRRAPG